MTTWAGLEPKKQYGKPFRRDPEAMVRWIVPTQKGEQPTVIRLGPAIKTGGLDYLSGSNQAFQLLFQMDLFKPAD